MGKEFSQSLALVTQTNESQNTPYDKIMPCARSLKNARKIVF